jgi:uncharacterized phage-associated protein
MVYNPRKAAQVIAFFANKNADKLIDVLKVVKLVYLADRECLAAYGHPILDEPRVSMKHGPVNSFTLSYIRGEIESAEWDQFLCAKENHQVAVNKSATMNFDELSIAEERCLDKVWQKFGHMKKFEIRNWTHDPKNIPEWEDPQGGSAPIPISRILRNVQVKDCVEITDQVEDMQRVSLIFANMGS